MNIEEFNIPMPWGHIAVKTWGNKSDKPVFVTHGRMDNAGAFDKLIPLLPNSFYYICVDLPSHGKSTFLPPFFSVNVTDFIHVYKLILDYFNRGKYILLGHSFGAILGNYFAHLYPQYVETIIGIDSACAFVPAESLKAFLIGVFESNELIYEKHTTGKRPSYTEREAIERVRNGRWGGPITVEAATPMTKRMIAPAENGKYHIIADQRLLLPMYPMHDENCVKVMIRQNPIMCPYLLIMCKNSKSIDFAKVGIEEFQKYSNFTLKWVNAGHDVHMSDPEMIAPYISEFMLRRQAKL